MVLAHFEAIESTAASLQSSDCFDEPQAAAQRWAQGEDDVMAARALIGRARELGEIDQLLGRASEGGGALLIRGEPGQPERRSRRTALDSTNGGSSS